MGLGLKGVCGWKDETRGLGDHCNKKDLCESQKSEWLDPEYWSQRVKNSSTTYLFIPHTLPASLIVFETLL